LKAGSVHAKLQRMSENTQTAAAAPKLETLSFHYVTRPGLLKITLVNLVFNILTLSLYRFWGKTNVRRHIWSSIHINGEPLEYTGTGKELFKGFLVVFGLFILPYVVLTAVLQALYGENSPALAALSSLFALVAYLLFGFAIYKARKYQLTRTLWRGIRGNLVGSAFTYSLVYFGSWLAKGFSLGWATPVMNLVLQEHIINDMRFGDAAFKFRGRAGPLYGTYAICWFLTGAFVVGGLLLAGAMGAEVNALWPDLDATKDGTIIFWLIVAGFFAFLAYMILFPALWAFYSAKQMQKFGEYTRFDGAQFKLEATARSLVWLALGNWLIYVLTLGLGWPFVQQRSFRYVINRLRLEGAVDLERIRQSTAAVPTRGEGLADAFDLGAW
jgi:uncharacterized membrane protein YjgN (DUF898 family)